MKRYGVLLGLIKSLTAYIQSTAQAPSVGVSGPNPAIPPRPPSDPDANKNKTTVPTLAQYLVHPLEPMNDPSAMAQETFFQAINTQLLPSVKEADVALAPRLPRSEDESRLRNKVQELRGQLERDSQKTAHLADYIGKVASGFNWEMRPDQEEEEDDDDDDLFGGGSDDDGDVQMQDGSKEKNDDKPAEPPQMNPRQGWTVADYLRLLDTGKSPEVPQAQAEASPSVRADGLTHTSPAVVAGAISIS